MRRCHRRARRATDFRASLRAALQLWISLGPRYLCSGRPASGLTSGHGEGNELDWHTGHSTRAPWNDSDARPDGPYATNLRPGRTERALSGRTFLVGVLLVGSCARCSCARRAREWRGVMQSTITSAALQARRGADASSPFSSRNTPPASGSGASPRIRSASVSRRPTRCIPMRRRASTSGLACAFVTR